MTVQGQQNVVKLQITVNDTVLVEVFQSQADFRSVESSLWLEFRAYISRTAVQTYCALFNPNWPR